MATSASARTQSGVWAERTVSAGAASGTVPVDCASSHNNVRGAVRYANPLNNDVVIEVWNLGDPSTTTPPAPLATFGASTLPPAPISGFATDLSGFGYRPSDRIQLGSQVGVSIGSGVSGSINQNYIELFTIAGTPTWIDQRVRPAGVVLPGQEPFLTGGHAHDLAITRDGAWAVVNADNWIHVIRLDAGAGYPQTDFNIGKFSYATGSEVVWDRPCTPNGAVDSVVVTNDRAVVTTARWNNLAGPLGAYTTWVYIIDLSDPSPTPVPQIVLEHEIDIEGATGLGDLGDWPHDLAITPHTDIENSGGQVLAVVTTRHAVAAYNLVTNAFLNSQFDKEEEREYQWQVDSVEMTGKAAVVIGDRVMPGGLKRWQVRMFGLSPSTGLTPGPIYPDPQAEVLGRAHDLAIEREHDVAIVRTSFDNIFIPNLSSPPPTPMTFPSANGADAHGYRAFAQSFTFHPAFSSDSVAIGTRQSGRLMAVTIGARQDISTLAWLGEADILEIDVTALPFSVTSLEHVAISSNATGLGEGCVPLDLAVAFNQGEVVVRSADTSSEGPNTAGADLTKISLVSSVPPPGPPVYAILQRNGGNGYPVATDALAVPVLSGYVQTTRWMLSVSQNDFLQLDYVHLAK